MSSDISAVHDIAGFIGGCLVEAETGLMIECAGGSGALDLETASAMNAQVVATNRRMIGKLGLNTPIEDIILTLGNQVHLIRPLADNQNVFVYVALDRSAANPGMARLQLRNIAANISFDMALAA